MDLISREAVIEVINKHKCDTSDIYLGVLDLPTIEAVPVENIKRIVERLKEMKMRYFLTIANTGDGNMDSIYEEVGNAIDRAIAIVKEEGGLC